MAELDKLTSASGDTIVSPDAAVAEYDFSAPPARRLEIVTALAALIFAIVALVLSRNIYLRMGAGGLDPKWWPTLLSILAAGLSAIMLGMALFGPAQSRGDLESGHPDGLIRMLQALALTTLYAFLWSAFGYVIPTIVYLFALLWVFGLRSWKGLVAFPLITTAFIYGLFHLLLRVPL
ncbi:tripartite tricarboxylate transporter TctB family protein [Devosia sp. YIM 151766]|uniref:tripartite tricarboxylate transporter TctB family protein n=1 Tax=Devosia sp. YIM 151766 TaxID=3017325 RepID=UPI00255D0838|nr:tripartite tricarboxylate transporter TctB family protein [Devosia sp. YIM 151766]WIY53219.1 tripartite tricarboxylate transporter TctB family protein [Devosia sp. YIM 151766]